MKSIRSRSRAFAAAFSTRIPTIAASFLAAWLGGAMPALGGVNYWTNHGPTPSRVVCLTVAGDSRTVYAASSGIGVFKSLDGGSTWNATARIESRPYVAALAVDPTSASTVYAAGDFGVAKTTDGGASWDTFILGYRESVTSLAVHPLDPSIVYAGIGTRGTASVLRSNDGGTNWKTVFFDQATEIASLVLDPQNPSTLYDVDLSLDIDYVQTSSTFESNNDGATWRQAGSVPGGVFPGGLVIDPRNSTTLYAASPTGLYKSQDAGATFKLANPEWEGISVEALSLDPRNPLTVYAAVPGLGVFRSPDGGVSWSYFNSGLTTTNVLSLAVDATGKRLYAGTDLGVFDYEIFSGTVDLSVGTDEATRLAMIDLDGRLVLHNIDGSGGPGASGPYGPFAGWVPAAIADSADGLTRVLWKNANGPAALWLVLAGGVQASFRLDYSGFIPVDIAASSSGTTRILWMAADGRIAIWGVENSGAISSGPTYGPYADWKAVAVADGPGGLTRVLWVNPDGRTAISHARDGELLASYGYGPFAGWTAIDIAVGGDGLTRILWSRDDRAVAVWVIDTKGSVTAYGPVYQAPEGTTARRIASGQDGSSRILFTDSASGAAVWRMSATGILESSVDAGSDAVPGSKEGEEVRR